MSTVDPTAPGGRVGGFQEAFVEKVAFTVKLKDWLKSWPGGNRGGSVLVEGRACVKSRGERGLGEPREIQCVCDGRGERERE